MSGTDKYRRGFSSGAMSGDPFDRDRQQPDGDPFARGKSIQFAGTPEYHPYGWKPQGTETCEVIWYDTMRQEAREGTFWHYKTLLRVGYQETDLSSGRMALVLYLADVNVLIEGHHLYPLMERLRSYECAQIEQFSPHRHSMANQKQLIEDRQTIITNVTMDAGVLFTSNAVKN